MKDSRLFFYHYILFCISKNIIILSWFTVFFCHIQTPKNNTRCYFGVFITIGAPADLVNISSGKAANEGTKKFLFGTLERGRKLRLQFENDCSVDGARFLKPVARTKVLNFATENIKESKTKIRKVNAVEGVRDDVFGQILAVVAKASDPLDLRHVLSYPITEVPLSLAHSHGILLKTDKATLPKTLESRQETVVTDLRLPQIKATMINGGIMLQEAIMQHSKSTNAIMARDLLVKICSYHGKQVHNYTSHIKDTERKPALFRYSQKILHYLDLTKPSNRVVQNCSNTVHSKKNLLTSSWRNGRNPNMDQSWEERLCIFHVVVHA